MRTCVTAAFPLLMIRLSSIARGFRRVVGNYNGRRAKGDKLVELAALS